MIFSYDSVLFNFSATAQNRVASIACWAAFTAESEALFDLSILFRNALDTFLLGIPMVPSEVMDLEI